jgi:hypothetical protein
MSTESVFNGAAGVGAPVGEPPPAKAPRKPAALDVSKLRPVAVYLREGVEFGAQPVRKFLLDGQKSTSILGAGEAQVSAIDWHPLGVVIVGKLKHIGGNTNEMRPFTVVVAIGPGDRVVCE